MWPHHPRDVNDKPSSFRQGVKPNLGEDVKPKVNFVANA